MTLTREEFDIMWKQCDTVDPDGVTRSCNYELIGMEEQFIEESKRMERYPEFYLTPGG